MKILITGICGFVGSAVAKGLREMIAGVEIIGVDNLSRSGAEINRSSLRQLGIQIVHGDVRCASDFEELPAVDWVVDAAANPSVLAGLNSRTSSRQLMEHNLIGTINVLEFCRRVNSGFIMLSTSRVYSIKDLAALQWESNGSAVRLKEGQSLPEGISNQGINERFSTEAPISLYGASKLASEKLALEYGNAFKFPVVVNRCGVLAGAGQFGKADQGIFTFWINAYLRRKSIHYLGFEGKGYQVRDCLHARDLVSLVRIQVRSSRDSVPVVNVGGGPQRSMSLADLSEWCGRRYGARAIPGDSTGRPFDVPWMVMDCALARKAWDWEPSVSLEDILVEIAKHAEGHPDWLELSSSA